MGEVTVQVAGPGSIGEFIVNHISDFVVYMMFSAGLFFMLQKAKVKKPWRAFVPVVRFLCLGKLIRREKDCRVYLWLTLLLYVIFYLTGTIDLQSLMETVNTAETTEEVLTSDARLLLFCVAGAMAVALALLIYQIRICLGICSTFKRRKRWILLMILGWPFSEFCWSLIMLIWGLKKSFVPYLPEEDTEEGAALSGAEARLLADGLTVNIKERLAKDGFHEKRLLRDIHLSIPKGHMVLLLGGSGAGKTTFLNAVTGYEPADAKIMLGGKDIYKEYELMKYDVGFVPQQDLMRGNDTVLRTLSDAAAMRLPDNMNARARKKRVQHVLESFGLSMLQDTLVDKLSGGQRKRLSIAMEFISDPSLFILDEPDSGLDGVVARGLFEKLRAIADEGKIVVVITHTPDRVIDLFDDVIVLAKDVDRTGRLAYYGPIKEAGEFFGKDSMEGILLSINQKEEGGEGRANEFVALYAQQLQAEKTENADDGKAGAAE